MSSSQPERDVRAVAVQITDDELIVTLVDGRRVATPLSWFPRLLAASRAGRERFELLGDGLGIRWPDLDEDLSVAGLLRGARSASR
ncbi:MAG: DUF2442 domain-containing protein [Myxococcales bacterium]|nr:DUF2442 domain-containing protein [Myxococcales bacterium]